MYREQIFEREQQKRKQRSIIHTWCIVFAGFFLVIGLLLDLFKTGGFFAQFILHISCLFSFVGAVVFQRFSGLKLTNWIIGLLLGEVFLFVFSAIVPSGYMIYTLASGSLLVGMLFNLFFRKNL